LQFFKMKWHFLVPLKKEKDSRFRSLLR
jgi:hypothetical protein